MRREGIGLAFLPFNLLVLVLCGGGAYVAFSLGVPVAGVAAIVAGVTAILILALIQSTLSSIYRVAVYRYAAAGELGDGFSRDLVQDAFRQRRERVRVF